ncbi:MAG: four helix bundle protein [Acidobacteria bacterium]|nr:four helix bundle protein [Acidobacteriota bacterium]
MSGDQKTSDYKDLLVWQKGIALVKQLYELTHSVPIEEKYGLASQMRRAAVSVPSNIAEGQARHTTGEFVQFLSHAEGPIAELDTQLVLAIELGYCKDGEAESILQLISQLRKMLNALRRKLVAHH